MNRSGMADLPLHGGRVPAWLARRMTVLGAAICESVLHHYSRPALLSRLSPVLVSGPRHRHGHGLALVGHRHVGDGCLEEGLNPRARELGVFVCGGRGRQSRNTPHELRDIADRTSLDGEALARASRLTARIDNNAGS